MHAHKIPVRTLAGGVVLASVLWYTSPPAAGTPGSGVTFTVLSRATVDEFDARRHYQELSDTFPPRRENWKIALEATRKIEVVTVLFTVQPGGHGGWHTHPGPALFTVSAGTLTMYEGDDPTCTPKVFPAGTGSLEADTPDHNHLLRNETNSVAQTVVTFLIPVGALLRTDLPDPGLCVF